jgi:hypothetical protein
MKLHTASTKKKCKEASYLSLNMQIYKSNGKDMTEKELKKFLDDFISFTQARKMYCAGGVELKEGIKEC